MKFLHTMLRVSNLDESIKFYVDILKLKLVRKSDYPHGKFTLAFLSYDINEEPFLELTYNWETDNYNLGNGFGHIAIGVDDLYSTCEEITKKGGKITREPGPMKGSKSLLAFVEDPNGYKIELLQRT
ncbi:MAG: lactoylglutathione lyase [Thermodesulfobacteriota bacterium]|nr:lactoylglutathione lyase [Deltaproteobacteria bacterium TMED58]RZP16235.1 MAG: lactoylglutathione lyase [Candidatus Dadabacteria bacterium]|tara:strand:- start:347 stop:727 length:381 start_codon:yes stop_codon:yes gene_type:complete